MPRIVKLNPFIEEKVWGGEKLKKFFPRDDLKNIGEVWGISTLKNGSSFLGDVPLNELCDLTYLVKIIDTSEDLSIQVHPNDDYALLNEGCKGKTEAWLVLAAEEGAGVYLGFRPEVTRKEFEMALKMGMPVDKMLRFLPVKEGDFILVPAGTIHAIGKGVTLCEVQQSSGVTYRVWDWNRVGLDGKPRELHINKAMDSLNFSQQFYNLEVQAYMENIANFSGIKELYEHSDFRVELYSNLGNKILELNLNEKESIIVLNGTISGDINLNKFDSAVVLESGKFELKVTSDTKFLLVI